jgi:hypothetical protein
MKPLQGFLQALQPQRVRGWAYSPADPDLHLSIEIRVDGAVVARHQASTYFADLDRAKIGRGDHGFLVQPETPLPVQDQGRVEVVAIAPDGRSKTLHLPAVRTARAPEPTPAQTKEDPVLDYPPTPPPSFIQPPPKPGPAAPRPPASTPPQAGPAMHVPGRAPRFEATDRTQRPVFVLGSARSGTTAMMTALRASGRYAGYNEGHLLSLALRLEQAVQNHYARSKRDSAPGMNTLVAHIEAQVMQDAVQAGFVELMRATFPTGFWLDKTPGPDMIRAAPLMLRIWPEARFIFMKRHPVDNIESRRRKFPTIGFRDHCRLWADSMTSWHGVRDLVAEVSLEVDQAELAASPDQVAERVGGMLNLSPPESSRMLAAFRTERPQKTGHDPAGHLTPDQVTWTPDQRAIFAEICTDAAALFGYGM